MALSVSVDLAKSNVVGNKRHHAITVTFDNQYAIAGEAITARQCGLVSLEDIVFQPAVDIDTPDFSLIAYYSQVAGKVQLFWADDAAPFDEVPDTTDVSAFTLRGTAVGY